MSNKNYHLRRGDKIIALIDNEKRKFQVVKDNEPALKSFEELKISSPLFKTLELKCITNMFTGIEFKKKKIRIIKITRS